MGLEYAAVPGMSTTLVPLWKWRLTLLALGVIVCAVALLVAALAAGMANVPRARTLVLDLRHPPSTTPIDAGGLQTQFIHALPLPPFTIEMRAALPDDPLSGWGFVLLDNQLSYCRILPEERGMPLPYIWQRLLRLSLCNAQQDRRYLIDNQGFTLITPVHATDWAEFPHLRAGMNTLYLHVGADSHAVFRINDEIAWEGWITLTYPAAWHAVVPETTALTWQWLRLYAG